MKTQQTYPPCDLLSSKTQLKHACGLLRP